MKVVKWLDDHFEESIMMIFLIGMVVIMGIQVVMRRIFASSLAWPEELTRYLFIWMIGLGMSYSCKKGIHTRIDILEGFFPVLRKPFLIIDDLFFAAFCIYLMRPAISVIQKLISTWQTSPAMLMPMAFVYLSMLVGFILSLVRIAQKFILLFMGKKPYDKQSNAVIE